MTSTTLYNEKVLDELRLIQYGSNNNKLVIIETGEISHARLVYDDEFIRNRIYEFIEPYVGLKFLNKDELSVFKKETIIFGLSEINEYMGGDRFTTNGRKHNYIDLINKEYDNEINVWYSKSNVPRKMGKGFFKIPKILFEGRSNFFMKYMNWIQVDWTIFKVKKTLSRRYVPICGIIQNIDRINNIIYYTGSGKVETDSETSDEEDTTDEYSLDEEYNITEDEEYNITENENTTILDVYRHRGNSTNFSDIDCKQYIYKSDCCFKNSFTKFEETYHFYNKEGERMYFFDEQNNKEYIIKNMFIPTLLNNEDFVKLDEVIKNLIINNVGNICETFLKNMDTNILLDMNSELGDKMNKDMYIQMLLFLCKNGYGIFERYIKYYFFEIEHIMIEDITISTLYTNYLNFIKEFVKNLY